MTAEVRAILEELASRDWSDRGYANTRFMQWCKLCLSAELPQHCNDCLIIRSIRALEVEAGKTCER